MTDTALNDWDAGYTFGDDPHTVIPAAVIPPVTHGVTPPVTRPVTSADTQGVTWESDGPVTRADDPADPLGIGQWDEAPDEPGSGRNAGHAGLLAWLAALAKGSPLLGGSGLAAELADPRPGTWGQHWHHVSRHPSLPDGTGAAIGFVAGHLIVTGPLKLAGKAMTVTGNALTWTGKRTDRAADHFASAAIFIALAAAMTAILVIAADQVISYLP